MGPLSWERGEASYVVMWRACCRIKMLQSGLESGDFLQMATNSANVS